MSLSSLLAEEATTIEEIADWLDSLSQSERREAVFSLDRDGQRRLFQRAAGAPMDLDHFVPADRGPQTPVIHHGRNTLPLPASQRLFQKRFARQDDGDVHLVGYNEAPTRGLIGPGYFKLVSTQGNPSWEERGPLVVDYFQVPEGPVPETWPRVVPNSQGLQFFVYNKTRDFMRRVSDHVSIGAAYKKEKPLDHYFVLVREDAAEE